MVADKWSKHLDSYASVSSPTPTLRRRSQSTDVLNRILPPKADPVNNPWFFIWDHWLQTPCLLITIGVACAVVGYSVISVVHVTTSFRTHLVKQISDPSEPKWEWDSLTDWGGLLQYSMYCVAMATIACIITQSICPAAGSSGLPEMRAILGGTIKPVLLSPSLIAAKLFGLVAAISAGLSVGKEGPFVHAAAAGADTIMRMAPFKSVHERDSRRLEVLSHACAAGVASTFGCVFGGILFAIEFTSTSYVLKMLPEAFVTAVIAIAVMKQLGFRAGEGLFTNNDATSEEESAQAVYGMSSNLELLLFMAMGVVCGLFGVLFVVVVDNISKLRNRAFRALNATAEEIARRKMCFVILVTLCVAPLQYFELLFGLHGDSPTKYLFESRWDHPQQHVAESDAVPLHGRRLFSFLSWGLGGEKDSYYDAEYSAMLGAPSPSSPPPASAFFLPSLQLMIYLPYKFIITALSVTLPLPVGLFTPVFLTGGVLGRIIGETVAALKTSQLISPALGNLGNYLPREYALIGAAAFSTGVTRAISTAVVIFELSNSPHLCLPISLAIASSYFVSQLLCPSIYQTLMDTANVPYLADVPVEEKFTGVTKVMDPVLQQHVLSMHDTYQHARELLASLQHLSDASSQGTAAEGAPYHDDVADYFPLVSSRDSMMLVGVVSKEQLVEALSDVFPAYITRAAEEAAGAININISDNSNSNIGTIDPNERIVFVHYGSDRAMTVPGEEQQQEHGGGGGVGISMPRVYVDASPFVLIDSTILAKAVLCFRRLKLNTAYILRDGRLVGVLTYIKLCSYISDKAERPAAQSARALRALASMLCGWMPPASSDSVTRYTAMNSGNSSSGEGVALTSAAWKGDVEYGAVPVLPATSNL